MIANRLCWYKDFKIVLPPFDLIIIHVISTTASIKFRSIRIYNLFLVLMQVFTVTYKHEVGQFAEGKLATVIIDSHMARFIRATSFSHFWVFFSWIFIKALLLVWKKIFPAPGATTEIESVIFVSNLVVLSILPEIDWWKYCVEIPDAKHKLQGILFHFSKKIYNR